MKKILTAIIALCYLVLSSGFVVNVHYCMGKIDGVSIGAKHQDTCNTCGMHTTESKGCCKDVTNIYKINDNHAPAFLSFAFQLPDFSVPSYYPTLDLTPVTIYNNTTYYTDTSPPFLRKNRCILFSNFRI